ncbi:MAG: hypothetical protein ACT6FG_01610 [Methanosarcinaceae archaeon]
MDMQTLIDILNVHLLVALLRFLIELGMVYILYKILSGKFINKELDEKTFAARKHIFTVIFISCGLYLFDFTGYPIAKALIDTGILCFVTIMIVLSLFYRITVVVENYFK